MVRGAACIVDTSLSARTAGIRPGLPLADARALLPGLVIRPTDKDGDTATLHKLALWCLRYSPWVAPDNEYDNGIWLDISGCAHLFGSEADLVDDLLCRLRGVGYDARAAIADTPGAAWAGARYLNKPNQAAPILHGTERLADAPVAGLRLPETLVADLDRLGLRLIGDLMALPRHALTRRFGVQLCQRLDQLSGVVSEPISPLRPVPPLRCRIAFPEPIGARESIDEALTLLLTDLEARLERHALGVRRLDLAAFRADGSMQSIAIGTSRPVRDPAAIMPLFRNKLAGIDPGFGIDLMMLNVMASSPLMARQMSDRSAVTPEQDIAPLIDRLANRLGPQNVTCIEPVESHIPERSSREKLLLNDDDIKRPRNAQAIKYRPPRPPRLLPQPEPIEVMAPVPDSPPLLFRWRRRSHRIVSADGPERIGPEWWLKAAMTGAKGGRESRDYYALEDEDGGRFWVYREGLYRPGCAPRWFLHGLFA